MKNRLYTLVFLDSRGKSLRRLRVHGRTVLLAAWGCAIAVTCVGALAAHGAWQLNTAQETPRVAAVNRDLRTILNQLEAQLPAARVTATRSETAFAQLWSKSGLGREPSLLGVGPLGTMAPGGAASVSPPGSHSRVLGLEPIELSLELERLREDGDRLQSSLAEVLEYFHDAEGLLSQTPSIRPSTSPWLTSRFGRRHDPINGQILMHKGIDFGGQTGDPIMAPADAVVIFVGRRGGYGQIIVLDHGYGLQTHFAHLSGFRVSVGETVRRGDVIGLMGSTGKSTGPHLHYEVRRMGEPLDPQAFLLD